MAFAIDVLHNLVIRAQLLFVGGHDPIHAVDGCVRHELLEIRHGDEVGNIRVEYDIICHANLAVHILVMLTLTDSIWEAPGCASFTIWLSDFLALRLIDRIMVAHIDKGLLVKELLLEVADHFLTECLDTKGGVGLDELCADGKLAALLHFLQVLIMLGSVLGIGDLINIVAHHTLELWCIHSLGELIKFFGANVHLFALIERVINLALLFLCLRCEANPIEVF